MTQKAGNKKAPLEDAFFIFVFIAVRIRYTVEILSYSGPEKINAR